MLPGGSQPPAARDHGGDHGGEPRDRHLTDKGLLFDGVQRNAAIRCSSVIASEAIADGILIEKATGKGPHLVIEGGCKARGGDLRGNSCWGGG